jgi:hypothetical protein
VEREIHGIQVAAGCRRRNSRQSAPGESWPRKDKNSRDPGKSFAGYFGFKNKELYLHRKTTQGIRFLVHIGKK